jgi:hypothetical protein
LLLLFVAGLVLVYAKWWAWYGGLSWGPRFFVIAAIPASLLLAVRVRHANELGLGNALTLVLLILSGWVGITGALADLSALDFCTRGNAAHEYLCWYAPEFSSLWHPLVRFPTLTRKTAALALYLGLVFAYVAWPVVAALARSVCAVAPHGGWATGWRL